MTEHPGGEAALGDDHARVLRRIRELRVDDRRKRQVAERPLAAPALVARLGDEPPRLRGRVEAWQRGEPLDAREPMTRLSAPLGVEEVVGEDVGVADAEAEPPQAVEELVGRQAETSGSDLTMPTPCSRFVPATASASSTTARETSASGSTRTIGSPASA
jgi:hypothetical protein